jgi:Ribbon-helix-helix protein, copG family
LAEVSDVIVLQLASRGGDDSDIEVSVSLPDDETETLHHLASRRGTSPAQVVHEAIAALRCVEQAQDAGDKLLILQGDGCLRELVAR